MSEAKIPSEPRPAGWYTPKRRRSGGEVLSHFFRRGTNRSVCCNHSRNAEGMTEGVRIGVCRQCNRGCPEEYRRVVSEASAESELAAREWQPIETAPRNGRNIWAAYPDGEGHVFQTEAWWSAQDHEWQEAFGCEKLEPTHWMPLPAPPTT